MSRFVRVVFVIALCAGCVPPDGDPGEPNDPNDPVNPSEPYVPLQFPTSAAVVDTVTMTSFSGDDACAQAELAMEDVVIRDMTLSLLWTRDHPPAPGNGWPDAGTPGGTDAGTSAPGGGWQNPSATNNQVAGVDEADLMKTDGKRIFTLARGVLYVLRSWPATSLQVEGQLRLDAAADGGMGGGGYDGGIGKSASLASGAVYMPAGLQPVELLLTSNGRLVVFSSGWDYGSFGSRTRITTVDVTNASAPVIERELTLPGAYVAARRIETSVRAVLRDRLRAPAGLQWWPAEGYRDPDQWKRAVDALILSNQALIRAQPLEFWVTPVGVQVPGEPVRTLPVDCTAISASNAPADNGLLSVVTLEDAAPDQVGRSIALGGVQHVYASATTLYAASNHWRGWGTEQATYLHAFDVSQPGVAPHLASGVVEGVIVDQFSLDEHEGHLRIATTANRATGASPVNRVVVLGRQGSTLVEVGRTEDLAPGERIQSARFQGDRGFVVTFRQVDPLFTFDLSDPAQPRKVGELKVPGFSTYLHPVGDTHLLGFGQYIPEDGSWDRSLQLSLFDVRDLAAPVQQVRARIGSASGTSEALGDHRAFAWHPDSRIAAIPYTEQVWTGAGTFFRSELQVFGVDPVSGLTPYGAIAMGDLLPSASGYSWWYESLGPRRAVINGDLVYAVSTGGARVARLRDLATPIASAAFPWTPLATPTP